MKRDLRQQILVGLVVFITTAATLVGGVILALNDSPDALQAGDRAATSTPFHISTLPPTAAGGATLTPSPPDTPAVTIIVIPTSTRSAATGTPTDEPAATSSTEVSSVAAEACQVPEDWVPYVVRRGDNLFRIGLRYGLTVDALMRGNCLSSIKIKAGATLYVPPVTPIAVPTSSGATKPSDLVPLGTQSATDGACTNPGSLITAPKDGTVLKGVVQFQGTASIPDLSFYKLEIREQDSSPDDYITFLTVEQPVVGGLIGEMDTAAWPNGTYWIRLTVVNRTGNYPERCARLYIISN
jgi:LysM repeat protein